ncbi:hypothetical protein BDN72DRAFT_900446 [Pluteus cervinus]|uniref:Uncharacterized protein n=1 Tax=Pluteus cervinus TaxID=181527 RepID=A0ACD3AJ58_9AGAR|nr:hypothetical protein BDN72DRAFT_900446 [Pluteus cervinus]
METRSLVPSEMGVLHVWTPKGPKLLDPERLSELKKLPFDRALRPQTARSLCFATILTQAKLGPYIRSAGSNELTRSIGALAWIMMFLGRKVGCWSPCQNTTSFDFAQAQSTSATPLFTLGVVVYTVMLLDLKTDLSSFGLDMEDCKFLSDTWTLTILTGGHPISTSLLGPTALLPEVGARSFSILITRLAEVVLRSTRVPYASFGYAERATSALMPLLVVPGNLGVLVSNKSTTH